MNVSGEMEVVCVRVKLCVSDFWQLMSFIKILLRLNVKLGFFLNQQMDMWKTSLVVYEYKFCSM